MFIQVIPSSNIQTPCIW